jgi:hypothetical protein
MDGTYDFSKIDGKMHYDDRTLTYAFRIHGESRADVEEKCSAVREWITSAVGAELYDDDFPEWHFTNVTVSAFGDLEYASRNGRNATLTVTLSADPYMINDNAIVKEAFSVTPTVDVTPYYLWRDDTRIYYVPASSDEGIYYVSGNTPVDTVEQSSYSQGIIVDVTLIAANYNRTIIAVPNKGISQILTVDGTAQTAYSGAGDNKYYVITAQNAVVKIRHVFSGTVSDDEIAKMFLRIFSTTAGAEIGQSNIPLLIETESGAKIFLDDSEISSSLPISKGFNYMVISGGDGDNFSFIYDSTVRRL